MMASVTGQPKLQKQRRMHSWWFVLVLVPLVLFSMSFMQEGTWEEELMEAVGFCFIVICVMGRSYCSLFIGGIKNKTVVRQGPFSVVRNPLYVFSFLGIIGIGIQSMRLSILALLVMAFVMYYRVTVRKEEAFLTHKFGEDYERYLKEVPRWIPRFKLWQEPEEVMVRPHFVRQTMLDALIFFLPALGFEFIAMAQASGLIPAVTLP